MSEAHLHNIAKEAERRALEAYSALEEGLKMVHATPKEFLPGGLLPMSFKIEDGRVNSIFSNFGILVGFSARLANDGDVREWNSPSCSSDRAR